MAKEFADHMAQVTYARVYDRIKFDAQKLDGSGVDAARANRIINSIIDWSIELGEDPTIVPKVDPNKLMLGILIAKIDLETMGIVDPMEVSSE
jgi:hypothetical protein